MIPPPKDHHMDKVLQMESREKIRVMVVDEDVGFLSLIRLIILSFGGCEIRQARSSEEALALFCSYRPDMTLMDIGMSRREGVRALEGILAEDHHARIVLVTALQPESAQSYLNTPVSFAYVDKRMAISSIRLQIHQHLQGCLGYAGCVRGSVTAPL
uniref:Response regulatory domain-containing protein n=1 Tax=Magnetococcus massalia (strain MO-1) TaxID=451514 RepID=A0A1S7LL74_MAGMO|nr:Conserved protein of unknown function. Containing response regulator receiver domain [Candidatus Magnetococcus massalia]